MHTAEGSGRLAGTRPEPGRAAASPRRNDMDLIMDHERLIADLAGSTTVLKPPADRIDTVVGDPSTSVEFMLDAAGRVEHVVVLPAGIFVPDPAPSE